jgi:hypothetical protein
MKRVTSIGRLNVSVDAILLSSNLGNLSCTRSIGNAASIYVSSKVQGYKEGLELKGKKKKQLFCAKDFNLLEENVNTIRNER